MGHAVSQMPMCPIEVLSADRKPQRVDVGQSWAGLAALPCRLNIEVRSRSDSGKPRAALFSLQMPEDPRRNEGRHRLPRV
jgi:hypothetical protein